MSMPSGYKPPKYTVGTPVRFVRQPKVGGIIASSSWSSTYDEHVYSVDLGNGNSFALAVELEPLDERT